MTDDHVATYCHPYHLYLFPDGLEPDDRYTVRADHAQYVDRWGTDSHLYWRADYRTHDEAWRLYLRAVREVTYGTEKNLFQEVY